MIQLNTSTAALECTWCNQKCCYQAITDFFHIFQWKDNPHLGLGRDELCLACVWTPGCLVRGGPECMGQCGGSLVGPRGWIIFYDFVMNGFPTFFNTFSWFFGSLQEVCGTFWKKHEWLMSWCVMSLLGRRHGNGLHRLSVYLEYSTHLCHQWSDPLWAVIGLQ